MVDVQELSKFLHLNYGRDEMKNLQKLCRLPLIFHLFTMLCESCFSHMNQIKKAYRSRMTSENLENLMFLTLNKGREINYQDIAIKLTKNMIFERWIIYEIQD